MWAGLSTALVTTRGRSERATLSIREAQRPEKPRSEAGDGGVGEQQQQQDSGGHDHSTGSVRRRGV